MATASTPSTAADTRISNRAGLALAVLVSCQLMIGLDSTIVTIALPKIQQSLSFSPTALSWTQNAYMLAFGGLLLLGGRAGDMYGRRRLFVIGVLVFAGASLLGGVAPTAGVLLAARAAQGVGAAIAAPSTLALIATNFAEGAARNRALAIYSAVSGAGGSLGLVLGGVLTDWVSWRWVLLVNVPIGLAIAVLAPRHIQQPERHSAQLDVPGGLTSALGMASLVYAFIRVSSHGWTDGLAVTTFAVAAALLLAFFAIERLASQPIVPLRLFEDRNRSAAYLNLLLLSAAMFGVFFFLTQFLQNVLGLSPFVAGCAFLPLSLALFGTIRVVPKLLGRFGGKPVMLVGATLITAANLWLSQLSADSRYATAILGPLLLFGVGVGFSFMPLNMTILSGVAPAESGAASGLSQTMMWVGGSLGLGILVTVFGTASRHTTGTAVETLAGGISAGFAAATVFTAVALLVLIVLIRSRAPQPAKPAAPVSAKV
jgi:EmrB/QacA subfamily drug resistance transporter